MKINLEAMTIEDCVENYYRKDKCVVLENGQVTGIANKED